MFNTRIFVVCLVSFASTQVSASVVCENFKRGNECQLEVVGAVVVGLCSTGYSQEPRFFQSVRAPRVTALIFEDERVKVEIDPPVFKRNRKSATSLGRFYDKTTSGTMSLRCEHNR